MPNNGVLGRTLRREDAGNPCSLAMHGDVDFSSLEEYLTATLYLKKVVKDRILLC